MSIKEIEARRDAELADIDRKIKAAHDRGNENEAERLDAFRAKRAADYFIQMTRDSGCRRGGGGNRLAA